MLISWLFLFLILLLHLKLSSIWILNLKRHGRSLSTVIDRDTVFFCHFKKDMFTLQGTDLLLNPACHPQTDGQTEVVNRCLKNDLRSMCGEHPKDLFVWLALAERWYNTSFHSSSKLLHMKLCANNHLHNICPIFQEKLSLKLLIGL